ncbi:STAS domain-containing protein [Sediminibacillus halophilus]|uniref:RsbT co-antagonist protein RsbR n=1 Tax=Sediminibacillus halophilus TaxID=482461 RepID=A0A1G9U6R6_9BACI|nr:STAS domain-containing protein [Sediminibacillus halophilus]SDM55374.1 rsbT co-antagonist protein RsbR [Sediminibacillus halophilus]
MKHELEYIGNKVVNMHQELAGNLEKIMDDDYTNSLVNAGMPKEDRTEFRAELIKYLGESLFKGSEAMLPAVEDWGRRVSDFTIRYNVKLSDALRAVSFYRRVIWDAVTRELESRRFAPITMLDVSKIVDPLLDKVSAVIGNVYEEHNDRLMKVAYSALEELSVPVVPVAPGIAAVPIVGEIDTHRAQLITEIVLKEGTNLELDFVILDISGVPMIDTMVSDQIFQILKALSLIGIKAIITGIRPEVAQTIGNLGLDYKGVTTRATLQQALAELGFKQVFSPEK